MSGGLGREQRGHDLFSGSHATLIEPRCVTWHLGAHVDCPDAASILDPLHETGGGINDTGGSHRHEEIASVQSAENAIELEGHLAKPANVGANARPARATGNRLDCLVDSLVVKRWAFARWAT